MQLTRYSAQDLAAALIRPDYTLRQTMEAMSQAGLRFVPVVDYDGRMIGAVADGDLRRYIAAGGRLDDSVVAAANRNPTVIAEHMAPAAIRSLMMRRGIDALPELRDGQFEALHVLWVAPSPAEMTVVLMAGGLGTRLSPLTDDCPKPLLRMGSKPILTHIIEHFRDQGVRRFILSVNYLAEMLVAHYGDGSDHDVFIDYVHETRRMGTGGALSLIDPKALSDNFMVCNGDLLNDVDVAELLATHKAAGWHATMVVREHSYTIPYGVVRRSPEGDFIAAEEKPTMHYCINAGIYMLSKQVLDVVPRGCFYDLPSLFSDLPRHGMRAGTYTHGGRWIDIGNINDFNRARSIYEGRKE
ncbi:MULTISPECIES: nucleotidyltransferase family protein [unclassified Paracoccus (in: a-proteobacteria)]|uniref:nucleotidyltransferase family protein n=1 Tax=unclassified Paracoccus (in: a-proteobacteria) TaxID=2688777 RepID=UPI0012B3F4B6|nr:MULTISPECIES: nucleotidyltransferase family protein [unclassified Paracoccus (in: a-proteobacteria)]UXU74423.1 nucleotidyltransferase family protein [Paracoccus sp. SMMA_5]UXU80313.1 nucleotidyltransferase family protein [Paracoccus sp. SMMA_5_TC]